jgi:hypothetical protein
MYTKTIEIFDEYCRKHNAHLTPLFNNDLCAEVRERLEQLSFIVSKVKFLEQTATEYQRDWDAAIKLHLADLNRRGISFEDDPNVPFKEMTTQDARRQKDAIFEMTLLTESFYYLAGRIRTLLRNKHAPMPGLGNFESEGVRNTRNKLLEHVENSDSLVFTRSFGCGGSQGPVLRAIRLSTQENIFPDRGLYVNAEEFRENLERLLALSLEKN